MWRAVLKTTSWGIATARPPSIPDVVFLMYHRVTGNVSLELDMPTPVFAQQMEWLAATGRVVSLDQALARLAQGPVPDGPLYVITFDDAFKDFYSRAFPIMRDFRLPSTVYVPTHFIDTPQSPPISRPSPGSHLLQPLNWSMLERLAGSSLLTIGAHSHHHPEFPSISDDQIIEEVETCDHLLRERLGVKAEHFAYPRGVWNERAERLIRTRYRSIAIVGGGGVHAESFLPYRIPRVPVLRSDEMRWFDARIRGKLIHEEQMVKLARRILRRHVASSYDE